MLLYGVLSVVWIRPTYESDLLGPGFSIVLGLVIYGAYALVTTLAMYLYFASLRGGVFIAHCTSMVAVGLVFFGVR